MHDILKKIQLKIVLFPLKIHCIVMRTTFGFLCIEFPKLLFESEWEECLLLKWSIGVYATVAALRSELLTVSGRKLDSMKANCPMRVEMLNPISSSSLESGGGIGIKGEKLLHKEEEGLKKQIHESGMFQCFYKSWNALCHIFSHFRSKMSGSFPSNKPLQKDLPSSFLPG